MIEKILSQHEGRTLEYKESASLLNPIIKSAIAFANTAGGVIVIGVRDKTREIIGVQDALKDEERITNALAQSIIPMLIPDIEIVTYIDRQLILVRIPHAAGPYYLASAGLDEGTYIRLGATTRKADAATLQTLRLFSEQLSFDELPFLKGDSSSLDWDKMKVYFEAAGKDFNKHKAANIGIMASKMENHFPSNGGMILFGLNRLKYFPDAIIRCARFAGIDRVTISDQIDIDADLPASIDIALNFIARNTRMAIEIGRIQHTKIPQYPPQALREALINAVIHADYAMGGMTITVAIFDDRIEISNPGSLPLGLTMERALSGSSRLRNKIIGRVFKELKIIEQWGSGLKKIIELCQKAGLPKPSFEERNIEFRVTIYSVKISKVVLEPWQKIIIDYLKKKETILAKEATNLWKVTTRTTSSRLKELQDIGILTRIATSKKDPNAQYVLTYDPSDTDDPL